MGTFRYGILPFVLILAVIVGLLVMEPHFSASIIILLLGAVMMFIGGTRLVVFILGLIAGGRQLFGPYGHLVFQCPGQVFEFALRPDLLGDVEPDRPHGHHGLVVTEYREADDAVGRFTAVRRLF